MLFKSKEYRICLNCALAAEADEDFMLCRKKGLVDKGRHCIAFRYDPLKRDPCNPAKSPVVPGSNSDFSL